jgi:apolipoprotein D and lipocalin family protein
MNKLAPALIAGLLVAACSSPAKAPPLQTVSRVELERYAGTWHEVALYPNRFQQACVADTTATYTALDDGRIGVRNRCRRADGTEMSVEGVAEVVDRSTNAKLKVSFLPSWLRWTGIGRGDYWVLYLSPDYRVAIVGEPSREYLWILARTPTLPQAEYDALMEKVRAAGYDPQRLRRAAPTAP